MRNEMNSRSKQYGNEGMRQQYGPGRPNYNSARSDYGPLAYEGRFDQQGAERDWWDRASDEVSSWFGGDNDREQRGDNWRRGRRDNMEYGDRTRRQYGRSYSNMGQRSGRQTGWRSMRAGDVMTRDVATVHPNDSVRHAAKLMRDEDCGALPVVGRDGRMIGMITDRDITVRLVADGYDPNRAQVSGCMTDDVFACHVSGSMQECLRQMSRHQVRRMPIVDDQNRIVGIIAQADIAQYADNQGNKREKRRVTDVVSAISEPSSSAYRSW